MVPDTSFFGESRLYKCIICGNEEPLEIKRSELDKEYLNPHALEKFVWYKGTPVDDDLKCTECAYFANLDIDTDTDSDYQTKWQPYLVATGIFLSPSFWVMLALIQNKRVLILISIIAIIVSTVIGICLFLYGYGFKAGNEEKGGNKERVKKIEEWFKGKI